MANNNVDNEPLVIHGSQGHFYNVSSGSGKLWSHGGRIRWKILFVIGITNKFYWQIFLSILYSKYHPFLTNVIACVSFEDIFSEQSSPVPFSWHHLVICGCLFIILATSCLQDACFLIVHLDKWNIKLVISSIRWERGQGGFEALFKGPFSWLRVFIKSGLITWCNTTL